MFDFTKINRFFGTVSFVLLLLSEFARNETGLAEESLIGDRFFFSTEGELDLELLFLETKKVVESDIFFSINK